VVVFQGMIASITLSGVVLFTIFRRFFDNFVVNLIYQSTVGSLMVNRALMLLLPRSGLTNLLGWNERGYSRLSLPWFHDRRQSYMCLGRLW
jgi:hypothetical protein